MHLLLTYLTTLVSLSVPFDYNQVRENKYVRDQVVKNDFGLIMAQIHQARRNICTNVWYKWIGPTISETEQDLDLVKRQLTKHHLLSV